MPTITFRSVAKGTADTATSVYYGFDCNGDYGNTTNAISYSGTYYYPSYTYIGSPETEEEKQARLERQEQWQREQEELRQQKEAAEKRAEELLKGYVGLEAFGKLHEVGYIELDSQRHKGRRYRVPANHMAYIEVLDEEGNIIDTLCVHPAVDCPPADHILTRLVMLGLDEENILAAANHWGPRDRSYY